MAFNPFHAFRKHQKPLIAALAIFCMFMFVLSSGLGRGGDAIYQLLGVIGISRSRGALVATLNGKKVTEGDLAKLRRDRELASKFLFVMARNGAARRVINMAQETQNKSRDNREAAALNQEINQILFLWGAIYGDQTGRFNLSRAKRYEFAKQSLETVRRQARIAQFTAPEAGRSDTLTQLDQLARVFSFEKWVNDPARNAKDFFFGGTPDAADLLDFLLWEQQADRLGIVLTEADVVAAVNREAFDQGLASGPSFNVEPLVHQFLAETNMSTRGATAEQLALALNREFRFLLAQESILGHEGGARSTRRSEVPQMPAAGTPREFLDWFRDQRTTLKVAVLPVPVQQFLDKVKEEPSAATLNDLYNEFKGDEPAPDRQLPAFKEPRRVRVETVSARSDDPFYQEAARARALAPAAGSLFGGPYGGPLAASWPVAFDPLWRSYDLYKDEIRSWIRRDFGVGVDLADRRPEYAAIAGMTIGSTPGGMLPAATTAFALDTFYRAGIAKVVASASTAGAGGQPLADMALPLPYKTTLLPMDQIMPSLFAKVIDTLAPEVVTKNLSDVATELAKLKSRPTEAQAFVTKAVKDLHLIHHRMAQARTSYELDADPALQPLRSAVEAEAIAAAASGLETTPDLAGTVLNGVGVFDPQHFPSPPRWSDVREPFLWWRIEDLPARERPYEVVRKQILEAWRFDQARRLARAEAERIEAEVNKNAAANRSAAESVKVLNSFGTTFELDEVARLLPISTPQAEVGQPYRPYVVPHDSISYPRPDLLDRLMTLKVPGDTIVLRNKPATTFYVAVLLERSPAEMKAFLEEFRNAEKPDSLWQQYFLPDRRRAYLHEVEKQMRIDAVGAKNVDEQGNIRLPEGITRGTESDSGE